MASPKEACEVNGLKVVAAIVVVILIGVMIWQYMPVEVETGTVEVCGNNLHQGEREISRQVEIKRVPRWQSSNYRVTENVVDCESCKEEVRRQSLEAERQARIAREAAERQAKVAEIASALYGQIYLGNRSHISVCPGQKFTFFITISNRGSNPLSFKVKVESDGKLELCEQKPVENPFSPLGNEMARRWWSQWPKLIGEGLDVGESISGSMERRKALNPGYSAHYTPQSFIWPYYQHYVEWGSGVDVAMVGVDAGHDYGIRLYAVYEGEKILLSSATVSIKYE